MIFFMVLLLDFYEIPMAFLWDLHDVSMGFLWDSYGIFMPNQLNINSN
jgi:hypothetical protein